MRPTPFAYYRDSWADAAEHDLPPGGFAPGKFGPGLAVHSGVIAGRRVPLAGKLSLSAWLSPGAEGWVTSVYVVTGDPPDPVLGLFYNPARGTLDLQSGAAVLASAAVAPGSGPVHVAAVAAGGVATLYVGGAAVGSGPAAIPDHASGWGVGCPTDNPSAWDDAALVAADLTPADVAALAAGTERYAG